MEKSSTLPLSRSDVESDARLVLAARALRAFADRFVAVLPPAYLLDAIEIEARITDGIRVSIRGEAGRMRAASIACWAFGRRRASGSNAPRLALDLPQVRLVGEQRRRERL